MADAFLTDGLTTFDVSHGGDQSNHLFFVFEPELLVDRDAGELDNAVNVGSDVVFGGWSPGGYYLGYGGAAVVVDVATNEDESGS